MQEHASSRREQEFREHDLERFAGEIERRRGRPEYRGMGGEEILKKSLRELNPEGEKRENGGSVSLIPDYAASASPETKQEIEHLLDVASRDGIAHADTLARKSSAFVLDAFHDAVVGRLYPELKRRGKIK